MKMKSCKICKIKPSKAMPSRRSPTLKDLKVPKGGLLNPGLRQGVGKLPKKFKGI